MVLALWLGSELIVLAKLAIGTGAMFQGCELQLFNLTPTFDCTLWEGFIYNQPSVAVLDHMWLSILLAIYG